MESLFEKIGKYSVQKEYNVWWSVHKSGTCIKYCQNKMLAINFVEDLIEKDRLKENQKEDKNEKL